MTEEPEERPEADETLPEESRPQGASSLERGHEEWEEHGGKGGDHPTPGTAGHDRPHG